MSDRNLALSLPFFLGGASSGAFALGTLAFAFVLSLPPGLAGDVLGALGASAIGYALFGLVAASAAIAQYAAADAHLRGEGERGYGLNVVQIAVGVLTLNLFQIAAGWLCVAVQETAAIFGLYDDASPMAAKPARAPAPTLQEVMPTVAMRSLCDADSPTELFEDDEVPAWWTPQQLAERHPTLTPMEG